MSATDRELRKADNALWELEDVAGRTQSTDAAVEAIAPEVVGDATVVRGILRRWLGRWDEEEAG